MKESLLEIISKSEIARDPSLSKARQDRVKDYPTRLPTEGMTWESIVDDEYQPPLFTAEKVLEKDVNDPLIISKREFMSLEGDVLRDENGLPINPKGPTGLAGRGILYQWGPNFTADALVTRLTHEGELQMIRILREDSAEPAIPGGFMNPGEDAKEAALRELYEETHVALNFEEAQFIYGGYVDDPRNTDNAWIETTALHLHVDREIVISPQAGDDAKDANWITIDSGLLKDMYASHATMVVKALHHWQESTGKIVESDGKVQLWKDV